MIHVTIASIEPVARQTKMFWLQPESSVDYIAGQYIELYLPHKDPDSRGIKRWFTLSSSPTEPLLAITTKFDTPLSTFKQALSLMQVGDTLSIVQPMGDFVLPKDTSIPLVFVAAGMGSTPVRSMLKWLIDTHQKRSIQVIYAARDQADFAFMDILTNAGALIQTMLSEPPASWNGLSGRLSGKRILELMQDKTARLYISGPEPMVETLESELLGLGVPSSQLVLDFFPNYPPV